MDNESEELVNRALYKRIKSMNRAEMEFFVKNIFNQGYEKAESETRHIDYNSLKANLSQIKGIGESRLNEIKTDDLMRFQLKTCITSNGTIRIISNSLKNEDLPLSKRISVLRSMLISLTPAAIQLIMMLLSAIWSLISRTS